MPLAIRFLGDHSYGVWITVLTMANWLGSCDLGLGNSLRNQLAKSFAEGDRSRSVALISTGYAALLFSACALLAPVGIIIIALSGHWQDLSPTDAGALRACSYTVLALACLDIVLRLGTIIYTADQRAQVAPLAAGANGFLSLIAIACLSAWHDSSTGRLPAYALAMAAIPSFTNCIITACAFSNRFRAFWPKPAAASLKIAASLLKTGLGFFGIQIGMAMTFQITTLITAVRASPSDVTGINVAEKIFGVISIGSAVALFPYWSRFTAADSRGEHIWILGAIRRLELAMLPITLGTVTALFFYDHITRAWLGDMVSAPLAYAIPVAAKYLIISINSLYCYYLNAINRTRSQFILYLTFAALSIPACLSLHEACGTAGMLYFVPVALLVMTLTLRTLTFRTLRSKIAGAEAS